MTPGDFEAEVAERDPARLRVRFPGGQQGKQAAAEVGSEHDRQGDVDRQHIRVCKRGHQQYDRQARVGGNRKRRADQYVEQQVARQLREQDAHAGGLCQRHGRCRDHLQGENHHAESEHDLADLAGPLVFLRQVDSDAADDQQRCQPRKVQRKELHHQGGADIGTEHHRQRRRRRDQSLRDERGRQQSSGGRALQQAGDGDAGHEAATAATYVAAQDLAQIGSEYAQHARTHDVRAPDQQGDSGKQVQQGLHRARLKPTTGVVRGPAYQQAASSSCTFGSTTRTVDRGSDCSFQSPSGTTRAMSRSWCW